MGKLKFRLVHNVALLLCGLWIVCDGLLSIIIYKEQSIPEHAVRVVRTLVGLYLLIMANEAVRRLD